MTRKTPISTGRGWTAIAAAIVALSLGGCGAAFFSGASSMRVEVEVYKGPLSKSEPVQKGELCAVLKEARNSLETWRQAAKIFLGGKCSDQTGQCRTPASHGQQNLPPDGDAMAPVNPGAQFDHWNVWWFAPEVDCSDCLALKSRMIGAKKLLDSFDKKLSEKINLAREANPAFRGDPLTEPENITTDSGACSKDEAAIFDTVFVGQAAEWATQLKAEAFFRAYTDLGRLSASPALRHLFTNYVVIGSEFGNQIATRADVLNKQFVDKNQRTDASRLPTSDYLRDSTVTKFVDLFDWFVGVKDEYNVSALSREDKVRVAKQLFADHYWSTVNEVHANGQGDVQMMFVKDEIGNWNLKSFSNDPGELLKAYSDVGKAIVGAAANLASGGTTGALGAGVDAAKELTKMEKALTLARKVSFGAPPASAPATDAKVQAFRDAAIAKLDYVKAGGSKKAEGSIAFDAANQPEDDSTITLNGVQFKFVAAGATPGPADILKGADTKETVKNAVDKLNNLTDASLEKAKAATYRVVAETVLLINYREPGTQGNGFTLKASKSPKNANATVSAGDKLAGGEGRLPAEMRSDVEKILRDYAIQIDTLQKVYTPTAK
jgi:hypothetical protein